MNLVGSKKKSAKRAKDRLHVVITLDREQRLTLSGSEKVRDHHTNSPKVQQNKRRANP